MERSHERATGGWAVVPKVPGHGPRPGAGPAVHQRRPGRPDMLTLPRWMLRRTGGRRSAAAGRCRTRSERRRTDRI